MGNKNTKTKGDKKREQDEKKQHKKEQKAKKASSKKSSSSTSSGSNKKKQPLARGGFQNSGSEFDTDFDSSHFTGADSESGVFHSAENISTSPYLDSCTKSERENSGILWRPYSPSTSRHPQVLSSRDFRDGFSLEACIPPEIARPITYNTDTTLSSSGSGGVCGAGGGSSTIGYRCHNSSSGSLKSKRSNSVKSHQQTPTFSRYQNDDVMSISTSSSQKSNQTGTGGYCTPLLNTPVFGRAERSVSPYSGVSLRRLPEPDRDSMDIVPLPYSPFDPEAKVFTTYNPTVIHRHNGQQQQQPYFNQSIDYRNLPKPTSPHPQRRAFSPKMTSSPFKAISSDDSSSSPTTPIPQRKATALLSDLFKSSSKKKKKGTPEEEKDSEQTSPRSKRLPLWKTWERSSHKKSTDKASSENRSSIFGTSRKTEKNKTQKKEKGKETERQRSPDSKNRDRVSDSTLQAYRVDMDDSNGNGNVDKGDKVVSALQPSRNISHNGDSNGSNATDNSNGNGNSGQLDLSLEHNRNSSPPVVKSAAFCIMRLEELERNIERTIKEKFPDAEPFLLRRTPPEEEFRGSKSLPTTPSLKKKLYVTRDLELSNDDVIATDLHNLSEKLDNLGGATRYYDESFEDPSTRAKSPVIVRRFGARTRHASISPKLQRAKTACIYNSPSEMERLADFNEESENPNEDKSKVKSRLSKSNGILDAKYASPQNKPTRKYLSKKSPSTSSSPSPKNERQLESVATQQSKLLSKQHSQLSTDVRPKTQMTRPLLRQNRIEEPEQERTNRTSLSQYKVDEHSTPVVEEPVIVSTESAVFGSISPKLRRHLKERMEQQVSKHSKERSNTQNSDNSKDINRVGNNSNSEAVCRNRQENETCIQTRNQTKINRRSTSLDSLVENSTGPDARSISHRVAVDKDKQFSGKECPTKSRVLPIPLTKHLANDENSSSSTTVSVKSRVRSINKSLSEEAAVLNQGRKLSVHDGESSSERIMAIKSLPSSPTGRDNERNRNRLHHLDSSDDAKSTKFDNSSRAEGGEKISCCNLSYSTAANLTRKHSADHVVFGSAVALPCRVYATSPTSPRRVTSPTLSPTTGNRNQSSFRFTPAQTQNSIKHDERNAKTQECEHGQDSKPKCHERRNDVKEEKEKDVTDKERIPILPTKTKSGRGRDAENEDRIRKTEDLTRDRIGNKDHTNRGNNKNDNDNDDDNDDDIDDDHNKYRAISDAQVDREQVKCQEDEGKIHRRMMRIRDHDFERTLHGVENNSKAKADANNTQNSTSTASALHISGRLRRNKQTSHDEERDCVGDGDDGNKVERQLLDRITAGSNENFDVSKKSYSDGVRNSELDNESNTRNVICVGDSDRESNVLSIGNCIGNAGNGSGTCTVSGGGVVSGENQRHMMLEEDGQCNLLHEQSQERVQIPSQGAHVNLHHSNVDEGGSGERRQGGFVVSGGLITVSGDSLRDYHDKDGGDGTRELFKGNARDRHFVKADSSDLFNEDKYGDDGGEETVIDDVNDSGIGFNSSRSLVSDRDIIGASTIHKDDKRFNKAKEDNGEEPVAVLKNPISQVISDMINVNKKHHGHDPQPPQEQEHEHALSKESNTASTKTLSDNKNDALVVMATPSPPRHTPSQTLEESPIICESHTPISCAVDRNITIRQDDINKTTFKPEILDNSKNEYIAAKAAEKYTTKQENGSSSEGKEDSDIERFMKSVKASLIPKVFGASGNTFDASKDDVSDLAEPSNETDGRQAPPPPSPSALDRLIAEFDEEDEDEGEEDYDEEYDDFYDPDGGSRREVKATNIRPQVNLALTRQNEMKEFTNRVINRLSDLLGSHSGKDYYDDEDEEEDDDDVFVVDSAKRRIKLEGGATYLRVDKDNDDEKEDTVEEDDNTNSDDTGEYGAKNICHDLDITNSDNNKGMTKDYGISRLTPPKLPISTDRVLYSRFSTSSSLSTSTSSSPSESELFVPPPPQTSNTMPGFEGFEKAVVMSRSQSKHSSDYFAFAERSGEVSSHQHYSKDHEENDDNFAHGDYNRSRSAQTRSYHSDDDVARGGGIPEYYDDKPLWNKRQKPPGHMSVKMASVRRRERRERWLKKRKRNRTDLLSACSSEVASEQSSTYGRSRLSLDGDFEDEEEVNNLSTQTQKGAMGSGILTSPKYMKPIMPFWGSRERIKTPPEPVDEELILCQKIRSVQSAGPLNQNYDIDEKYCADFNSGERKPGGDDRSDSKTPEFGDGSSDSYSNLKFDDSQTYSGDSNKTLTRNVGNVQQGVMKIPGLEETFDELMSVQQILEGLQVRAPSVSTGAAIMTSQRNVGTSNKNTPTTTQSSSTTTPLTHSSNTNTRPDHHKPPKCMPLTVENIKSMKDMYRESSNDSNNNTGSTFNISGRLSRLSNTNRTESDLDLYSEYRDDASTDSNLYADDEGDDNDDDDANDPYTTAEDDLDASVGDTDLESSVVVSCTFYNSNTYQQPSPHISSDLGSFNRSLVFTASPGASSPSPSSTLKYHHGTSTPSTVVGDGGSQLTTPTISFRSSTEEDNINFLRTGGVFGASNLGAAGMDVRDISDNYSDNNNNNNTTSYTYDINSQSFTSSAYHSISSKDNGNVPTRTATYVRSNSAPGAYTGQQLTVSRDATTTSTTGSYHADMTPSNCDDIWTGRPPFERSRSFHHPSTQQRSLTLAPLTGSGTGAVSSTFQNAREQMMDIQHHLQALRRQMEGLQDDLTTSTSYTLTPEFSAYDSK